ncbi:hypothetical protein ASPFODRAFT_544608 [Aspergillus luchuensis CBS 106.47]|uniref:Uncharacterized protein n=1 Tax=Aspergillus luchuensis (strain CBS 106.47) TaxID=1137211 RepID=A0A1M3TNV7_ASPLC|nr:hypothetical protein ASPFODRAFT_544608 [Aspergillus luchuensis CBS 106.47]
MEDKKVNFPTDNPSCIHGYSVRSTELSTYLPSLRGSRGIRSMPDCRSANTITVLSPILMLQILLEAPAQRSLWGDMWTLDSRPLGSPFVSRFWV